LSRFSYLWLASSLAMLVALIVAAVMLPRSFALTAFSDVIQSLLLISGTAAFVPLALRSRGRIRLFWGLITLGVSFWLSYQLYWTYYEVVLRRDVPDLCAWDAILFLHIVPFMAALAIRPHVPRDEYAARIGQLDFALLVIWWFYLYVLIVMPWQYVLPDVAAYNRNLNIVYGAEKIALLASLVLSWISSKGSWRNLYGALFGSSLCYSASSTMANWAIGKSVYYSGSLYDVPLVVAMAWLTWIGLTTKDQEADSVAPRVSTVYGVWIARLSMIAVFSLPLFAAWSMSDKLVPPRVRTFRLALTLLSAFLMGTMVFLRQRMLDMELIRLLGQSRNSFESLKRLQAQILQSEKLASITQLVGGAAHELNNPITAMLGYSDLLLNTQLTPEQQPVATKIGQYVRRTRSLVASLISFARQSPAPKAAVDLNTLARTALKLAQPQWEAMKIEIRSQFETGLPKVYGDSNQLLQVCLQLVANSLHVLSERGGRVLIVSSELQSGKCVLKLTTEATNSDGFGSDLDARTNAEDGLALSACQGILHDHRGTISSEYFQDGALLLRVELPALDVVPPKAKDATVPVLWQSRPYA
jgi:signal transduction histidine kinase